MKNTYTPQPIRNTDLTVIQNINEIFNILNKIIAKLDVVSDGGTTGTGSSASVGTTNYVPKWTNGPDGILGDSNIKDDGVTVKVKSPLEIIEGGASPEYYTKIQGGDQAGNIAYTLPTAAPDTNGKVLSSTTSGVLSWATMASPEKRGVTFVPFETFDFVAPSVGTAGWVVPEEFDGMVLIEAIAGLHTKGVTGSTVVQIRRRRGSVESYMLLTGITLGDVFYANNGVFNNLALDIVTGDMIFIDVESIHSGTPPKGLSVTVLFGVA